MENSRSSIFMLITTVLLIMSLQSSPADCRSLRLATAAAVGGGKEGARNTISMETSSLLSSENSRRTIDNRISVRGLMIILASGPSKRGPGH
ncbi:hypothetical protein AAHA92_07067 [Salvia divinorum]|uniref:Uncharacterized protein n=1 Tax=Salvia divinorum TaxID=28513 RepID=A0ABD1I7Q6_SALDI